VDEVTAVVPAEPTALDERRGRVRGVPAEDLGAAEQRADSAYHRAELLYHAPNRSPHVKDAFHRHVIHDDPRAVCPDGHGTKAALWYQYYFHTERGRAGLMANRHELCKLLWRLWSPNWKFDDATYDRTAKSFDNPDFVDVVIHSYRHRIMNAPGEPRFKEIEAKLATRPRIQAPSITLYGADDGIARPTAESPPMPAQAEHDATHWRTTSACCGMSAGREVARCDRVAPNAGGAPPAACFPRALRRRDERWAAGVGAGPCRDRPAPRVAASAGLAWRN